MPSHPPVSEFLSHLALAPRQCHKTLTIWPLVADPSAPLARGPAYVSLSRALEDGALSMDEIDEAGSVPHVRVTNRGGAPVLVLFGEEIIGAKQNRIVNASFLVAGKSETVIDVSCVEQGRWDRRAGTGFAAGRGVTSSSLRRKMASKVRRARAVGQSFDADQGEVWDQVSERLAFSQTASRTGAYADYQASRVGDIDQICGAFRPVPGQVGFVAAISDAVVGLEAIGRPEVFEGAFLRLLQGYAIDAVDAVALRALEDDPQAKPRFDAPEPFIAAVSAAPAVSGPSLGLGQDVRIEGAGVSGCALVEGGVVHLTGFPQEG